LRFNSPKAIQRATQASINRTARDLAVVARRKLAAEVNPRSKRGFGKLVTIQEATLRGNNVRTSANINFAERGMGVEMLKSTKIVRARARKGRGASGRWNVTMRGQGTIKAFKLGADKGKVSPTFVRSKGKLKRLFAHTVVQSLHHINLDEDLARRVPALFIPQFLKLVDFFDGYDTRVDSGGRKVKGPRTVARKGGGTFRTP
jgi:hypothetical protein